MIGKILLTLVFLSIGHVSIAQEPWPSPDSDIPICVESQNQLLPKVCSDDRGGVFIAWIDYRLSNYYELRVQYVDAAGTSRWKTNGEFLGFVKNTENGFSMTGDGEGGVYIVWADLQDDIHGQHILRSGLFSWSEGGIAICTGDSLQINPVVVRSGARAIAIWQDYRNGTSDIYAQRLGEYGLPLWEENGIVVSDAAGIQSLPRMVSDGADGAIVAWDDKRGGHSQSSIVAQRIDSTGFRAWNTTGVSVVTLSFEDVYRSMTADGRGGAFFAWSTVAEDASRVRAQRLDASGNPVWQSAGVTLYSSQNEQIIPTATGDGLGNLVVIWEEFRSGTGSDLFMQSLDSAGVARWSLPYISIAAVDGDQRGVVAVADSVGGVIMTWEDGRSDNEQIYVQSVDRAGDLHWIDGGIPVSADSQTHRRPFIAKDSDYGGFIAWVDYRNGTESDIYATHVNKTGSFDVTIEITLEQNWNLVSVPISLENMATHSVFPPAISSAYSYRGAYVESDSLLVGSGYWLKFAATEEILFSGETRPSDTLDVVPGWNLVGAGSNDILVEDVQTDPADIIVSPFYGYSGGYFAVQQILRGRGYWVKTTSAGKIILSRIQPLSPVR